jgi:hypothetical protein
LLDEYVKHFIITDTLSQRPYHNSVFDSPLEPTIWTFQLGYLSFHVKVNGALTFTLHSPLASVLYKLSKTLSVVHAQKCASPVSSAHTYATQFLEGDVFTDNKANNN